MEEIIKFKKAGDKNKDTQMTQEDLNEVEDRYQQMLYEKEDKQIGQESEL